MGDVSINLGDDKLSITVTEMVTENISKNVLNLALSKAQLQRIYDKYIMCEDHTKQSNNDQEEEDVELVNASDYKVLIDSNELQQYVLDFVNSDKIDKVLRSTTFKESDKSAIIYGMTLASMMTSQCKPYCFKFTKKKEAGGNQNGEI